MTASRTVALPSGETVPALGQGTWGMGDRRERRTAEIAALRLGIELGMTLIDTAEMYADGVAEEIVGEAVAGQREKVFVVSKVYPHNASRRGVAEACERSLRRLNLDHLDLYLLHWRGSIPLGQTVEGFESLRAAGKIRAWGVSNFDVADMEELARVAKGSDCATNQVLYNIARRGPEYGLLPWMEARAVPAMAYSPVEQGRLSSGAALSSVARKHGATPYQVALAFAMRSGRVMAIPKASNPAHVKENHGSLGLSLDEEDLRTLDAGFPPPRRKAPLEMI